MQIILNVSPVVIEVFMAALLSLAVFRRRVSYAAFAGMLCGALGASLLFLHFLSNIGFRIPFSVILYTAWFSLAFYTEFRKALVLSCALVAYCFFGDAILLSPLLFVYSRSISLLEMSSHYPALSLYAKILELIGILLITRFVQRNARGKDRWISCGAKISIGLFAVSILINAAFFYAYRSNAANWGMQPETMLLSCWIWMIYPLSP